jgi:hypothetical protein
VFDIFCGLDNAALQRTVLVLSQDFFCLYFVYPINEKTKPSFSMPHDMLVGSAIFLAREDLDLKSMLQSKTFGQNIDNE